MKNILRQVYIYKGKDALYYRHFGKALKKEVFDNVVEQVGNEAFSLRGSKIGTYEYFKFKISYISEPDLEIIFFFVTGLTDSDENIKKELIKTKKEFLNLFGDILHHRFDAKTFEVFDPIIDSAHRNLRPKLSLVGFSGVGKTTITKLIKAEEIPMQHIPTITGDIATIKIGKLHFHLWDFAGQEQFSYLWNNFIKGSDAVLLITDSSLENVEKSKFFLELIKDEAPDAHTAVIGNKQDLPTAIKPDKIEEILSLKTYSMIAKDPQNRDKMIQIIADILEMNAEVSPLLKPLLDRDKYTEQAKMALEAGEFENAAILFEKISDLCLELGDDSLSKEFYDKAMKIKSMYKQLKVSLETKKEDVKAAQTAKEESSLSITDDSGLNVPKIPESPTMPYDSTAGKPPVSGIELKPEDFLIKQRPKTVTHVPEDAKSKLKTTSWGNGKNLEAEKKKVAVSPLELFKTEEPEAPKRLKPPISLPKDSLEIPTPPTPVKVPEPPATTRLETLKPPVEVIMPEAPKETGSKIPSSEDLAKFKEDLQKEMNGEMSVTKSSESAEDKPQVTLDTEQAKDFKKTLLDLKLKKANISKMALDFEMKELMGELTAEEVNEKKAKIEVMEKNIDKQIKELEDLMN